MEIHRQQPIRGKSAKGCHPMAGSVSSIQPIGGSVSSVQPMVRSVFLVQPMAGSVSLVQPMANSVSLVQLMVESISGLAKGAFAYLRCPSGIKREISYTAVICLTGYPVKDWGK